MPTVIARISVALRFEVEVPREALTIDPEQEYVEQDRLLFAAIHEQVTANRIIEALKKLDVHAQNMGLESEGDCRLVSVYFDDDDYEINADLQDGGFIVEDEQEFIPRYVP